MSLKLISGMMKSSGEEALLVMDAGGTNQMVVIDGKPQTEHRGVSDDAVLSDRVTDVIPAQASTLSNLPGRPHRKCRTERYVRGRGRLCAECLGRGASRDCATGRNRLENGGGVRKGRAQAGG
ncbi:hypothetical protein B5E41_14660 [Rhizobium esperanzae]|uniref:Uncharacterized protein n=1 Tax=Rhizobium esperanzae TaxID=1967781 RepID=A0A246DVI1_9HYPH|nr:hypothetical protein B5E41_14660 [Rhizobium esperanzae]